MTTTIAQVGRNLHITLVDIEEPFIITPLPGFAGERATDIFIKTAAVLLPPEGLTEVWQLAVDGVDPDGQTIFNGPVYSRIKQSLSLAEGESVIVPSLMWQTTLGIDGVNAFLEGGEGMAGTKKALDLLLRTLAISPTRNEQNSGLATLTLSQGRTPPIDASTTTLDKLPLNKRGFMQNRRDRRARG